MIVQSSLGQTVAFGAAQLTPLSTNLVKDFAVTSPPDDSISSLSFSPGTICQNYLIAGSWDSNVRCWQVEQTGNTVPKSMQTLSGPVLDICWSNDGTKVFLASCDKSVKCWDLASNQTMVVAAHDAPIKTCHWVNAPNYTCLMTGSWDKTLRFWDTRTPYPIMMINLPEKVYSADVEYPMAVVATANQEVIVYRLESKPEEFSRIMSPLKHQHRCIAIFKDAQKVPTGVAIGGVEGRVSIQYVNPVNMKDNYTFPCHRSISITGMNCYDCYAVNDLAFHPVHGTLATAGSDGRFGFWDTARRKKLKTSELKEQSVTRCCFNADGQIFAYAVSYDWSKGHEFYNPAMKSCIFLRSCMDETKSRC